MKLNATKSGACVKITGIDGDTRFLSRITSIGLTVGSKIEVIQNQKSCPLLVYARDTMIAINNSECGKITCEVTK